MKWRSFERPIEAPKQLLVEGRTPEIFFREWVEAIGLKGQVEVRDYGSLTDLTDFLKVFTGYKEFREIVASVGIIRDAEDKPAESAFQSVCRSLQVVGLTCPEVCGSFSIGQPRTGVFVLPDCQQSGMLETLCWTSLKDDQRKESALACVMAHLDCLGRAKVQTRNPAKAKVWTYLAGQGEFDPMVGRAAQAGIWNWESAALRRLSDFIKIP
jgi:hypothetical protein